MPLNSKEVPHLSVHKGLQLYALLSTAGKLFPFWYTRKKAALKEAANAEKQQTLRSYRSIIVREEKHMQVGEKKKCLKNELEHVPRALLIFSGQNSGLLR